MTPGHAAQKECAGIVEHLQAWQEFLREVDLANVTPFNIAGVYDTNYSTGTYDPLFLLLKKWLDELEN